MPTIIPLDGLLGAILIGILISTVIYGITCLQVYLYYTEHCSRDPTLLKVFVGFLMLLDTLHVIVLAHVYYFYTVSNFGDYLQVSQSIWSLLVQVAIGGFLSLCVQMFYVRRVYILSGRKPYIPIFIILVALAQFSASMVYTVDSFSVHFFAKAAKAAVDTNWSVTSLSLDIVVDTTITISMIYYLWKSKTTFAKTNRMVNMLITYILNTCLLTTICTATCLALFVTQTTTLVYAPFYFVLVRLYSCSLMSTLNSRNHVREVVGGMNNGMITLSSLGADTSTMVGHGASVNLQNTSGGKFPFGSTASTDNDLTLYNPKAADGGHVV